MARKRRTSMTNETGRAPRGLYSFNETKSATGIFSTNLYGKHSVPGSRKKHMKKYHS